MQVMATEVAKVFDAAYRDAIAGGRLDEAERLQTARQLAIVDLATLFSFRRQEADVLKTFFDRENTGTSRFLVAGHRHRREQGHGNPLPYPGLPNPIIRTTARRSASRAPPATGGSRESRSGSKCSG